ncbi:hypothetical protein PHLH6_20620 [Pseudomonas sp. Seg1]|nr:hypothetical protein PHLH6_20620 [Pseudomonas sp. Seg1]
MAKSNAERSEKVAAKRKGRGEVEVRFHSLPATRQAFAELRAWGTGTAGVGDCRMSEVSRY